MRPRIVVWCGRGAETWGPPKLDQSGLGGSETAVVKIGQRLARDGWRVDVYGHPGEYEGEHDEVGYWEMGRLGADESCDLLVSWRQPALDVPISARARVLWLHDHNGGEAWRPHLGTWDRVLGVSAYHRDFLREAYDLPAERVRYVPNGVDLERFDPTIEKVPFSAIYASSPDRGLLTLLDLWPRIADGEPTAKLTVAYGFATMDAWINAGRHDLGAFKEQCLARMKETPGVEYVGRLPQDELARRYAATVALLYPSDFLETSFIGGMEAMAGGCIPITSSCGAVKETIGEGGVVVWGPGRTRSNPYSPAWRDFYVNCARGVLFERVNRRVLQARARERVRALTWDIAYQRHWLPLIEELLHPERTTAPQRELVAAG